MWDEKERIVHSQLSGNEQLLWFGQPQQGIFFRLSDIFLIPFGLIWLVFAAIWEIAAIDSDRPFFIQLLIFPFVLLGLFIIVARFFSDARARKKTYYAITNERIVMISGALGQKVKSLSLRTLIDVTLEEKPNGNGIGTISFGSLNPTIWGPGSSFGIGGSRRREPPQFERINQAKNVYEMIRAAREETV